MTSIINIGIDIGSTTIKAVALKNNEIVFSTYDRHYSDIKEKSKELINTLIDKFENNKCTIKITGSSGLFVSERLKIEFIQEVIASTKALESYYPHVDVAIELGGEDAKITYFGTSLDQRMNGVCAGGTGAFIDQMASLLNTTSIGINELAKDYKTILPIASRCGVFAKSDIQPLLNEGAAKEDIAVSVLQAVVNQTISGLACGKPIRGNIAFLGGPLHFLDQLRKRFIETLDIKAENIIAPDNAQYFVALGAAIDSKTLEPIDVNELSVRIHALDQVIEDDGKKLDALFKDNDEYKEFLERHSRHKAKRASIVDHSGPIFVGIDAGSTTTKIVAITENGEILEEFYGNNLGKPLLSVIDEFKKLYKKINKNSFIGKVAITGYGEHLIKAALNVDVGEIETVAHYTGANHFLNGVDFVIDIGGQDMKSLKIKDGFIESIMLNEACSSGCGSFIETFSKSLGLTIEEFVKVGIESKSPVDLGSRCTVFMNSRVKQAQKEGASVGDISAGISYSVIKNALYKVIRLKNVDDMGENIVVQGGTFYNDAVLRTFELIVGREVIRPDIAGVMGAFGAALIARNSYDGEPSKMLSADELDNFIVSNEQKRCMLCGNNCLMTVSKFNEERTYISGNRCDRALDIENVTKEVPNIYDYKYKRVFAYKPLAIEDAKYGVIGIPRVLNIYDNYPMWATVFSKLGYRVQLSARSTREIFNRGMESIPSESVCYPAKIAHGHIEDLIEKGVRKIFYPSIPYEIKSNKKSDNNFNCPIVTSYPETIKCNMENIHDENIEFISPFLPLSEKESMKKVFYKNFKKYGHTKAEIYDAIESGYTELEKYKLDVQLKGEEILKYVRENDMNAIVLAGRPYHIDPEINHGIPSMICGYNIAVLSEDSINHLKPSNRPLRVVDQWSYHSRLYDAASFVSVTDGLEMVQLNSFGCGLDAVTSDQVAELLSVNNKSFTLLKIDEINNLGAARIRIRSLIAVINSKKNFPDEMKKEYVVKTIEFTEEMKKNHTILCPQMSPIHFDILKEAFLSSGFNFELLEEASTSDINEGLKVVNNDACYPSIIVIGQLIGALKSGKYDLQNTSVMMSQTGGGCRATNYIGFIRKALSDSGLEHIPVISLNAGGLEKNSGFKLDLKLMKKLSMSVIYGDLLMRVLYKVRPYEKEKGSANELFDKWNSICKNSIAKASYLEFVGNIKNIVSEFDNLPTNDIIKPKVGIVGEILVKYHPKANNFIIEHLESEGAEVVVPDLADFFLYSSYNTTIRYEMLSTSFIKKLGGDMVIGYIEFYRKEMKKALEKSSRFEAPKPIQALAKSASKVISLGHQTGEGWFLTAEIIELLESGVNNIACLQPFACLPNHITGKGIIKELKKHFPLANIAPIDYDPGASEVNQINRIKLMLSTANKNM